MGWRIQYCGQYIKVLTNMYALYFMLSCDPLALEQVNHAASTDSWKKVLKESKNSLLRIKSLQFYVQNLANKGAQGTKRLGGSSESL